MTNKLALVVHQRHSDPGRVGLVLRTMGYRLDIVRSGCGEPLPVDFDAYAGAVVFGGPMSANDDHEPFIRAELDWIPKAVETGLPFLGVCLGAQLFARAAGGRVAALDSGKIEVGYVPIRATAAGRDFFQPEMHVYQFHREGMEPPSESVILAEGEVYRTQAFRHGANAWGIQFHPEVTEQMNRRWNQKGAHRLVEPGAQQPERQYADRRRFDGAVARWLPEFLATWLASDTRGARPELAAAE